MTTIPADAAPCVTRDGWCETHNCPSNLVTDHAWVGIAGHPDDPECSVCQADESEHTESTR